jgi:hypothetical protein
MPTPALDREPPFAVQLMLGQELGVRGQVTLFTGSREAFVVEGFYGGLYTDIGSSQALGAGARWLLWSNWTEVGDALVFGPGLDVFFGLNQRALILLTPSVDVAWAFKLAPRLQGEIGLDTGRWAPISTLACRTRPPLACILSPWRVGLVFTGTEPTLPLRECLYYYSLTSYLASRHSRSSDCPLWL